MVPWSHQVLWISPKVPKHRNFISFSSSFVIWSAISTKKVLNSASIVFVRKRVKSAMLVDDRSTETSFSLSRLCFSEQWLLNIQNSRKLQQKRGHCYVCYSSMRFSAWRHLSSHTKINKKLSPRNDAKKRAGEKKQGVCGRNNVRDLLADSHWSRERACSVGEFWFYPLPPNGYSIK